MAIRQRGNSFQVDVTIKGHRYREDCKTHEEAQQREAHIRAALLSGKPVDLEDRPSKGKGMTLKELQKRTYEREWRGTKGERTALLNSTLAVKYFGADALAEDIDTEAVDEWVSDLETSGNSNGTINRKLSALSTMLHFAHERGWITSLPLMGRKKEGEGRIRFLVDEEEAKLLATCRVWGKQDEHDLFMFLIDTGARLGEALRLEWSDTTGGKATFWETKGGQPRTVPLTNRVQEMLRRRQATGIRKPFDLEYGQVRRTWERIRTHLRMNDDPHWVIHILRHTCASRLVQRGVSLPVVQKWLGHKTITMTMRYAHLAPENLMAAVHVLEQEPIVKPNHLRVVQ